MKDVGLLCLTRKVGESICIAGNIIITINGIDQDRVKIGIKAPKDIPIMRTEILTCNKKETE